MNVQNFIWSPCRLESVLRKRIDVQLATSIVLFHMYVAILANTLHYGCVIFFIIFLWMDTHVSLHSHYALSYTLSYLSMSIYLSFVIKLSCLKCWSSSAVICSIACEKYTKASEIFKSIQVKCNSHVPKCSIHSSVVFFSVEKVLLALFHLLCNKERAFI